MLNFLDDLYVCLYLKGFLYMEFICERNCCWCFNRLNLSIEVSYCIFVFVESLNSQNVGEVF